MISQQDSGTMSILLNRRSSLNARHASVPSARAESKIQCGSTTKYAHTQSSQLAVPPAGQPRPQQSRPNRGQLP